MGKTNWVQLLKNYVDTLETIVGTEGGVALADKLTAARAALLDQITAARMAELDAANIPADLDTIKGYLDTEVAAILAYVDCLPAALGDLVTKNLAQILSDSVAFAGADIAAIKGYTDLIDDATNGLAAIKAEVEGLAGAAMRGTDNAALAASWTAALATALGNYTAARAVYLDNINQAGLLQVTAARAALLDQITAARLAELDAANIPADVDNILLDTQIRRVSSGIKAIDAATTKYLHIDSGTNGAEILAIIIKGVVGADWTVDVYVPTDDAVAAPAAGDKRDSFIYVNTDTKGGLLGTLAIAYNVFLDFTNDSGGASNIDDVVVVYRSRAALTLSWEA